MVGLLLAAFAMSPTLAADPSPVELPAAPQPSADAIAAYEAARSAYEERAREYWTAVSDKRKARVTKRRNGEAIAKDDYVLDQPPRYDGPPNPLPNVPNVKERPRIPTKSDFLAAARKRFQFAPRTPASELDFKRAYAAAAKAAGITSPQAVRIYGFEAGGNGTYDVQAGLEYDVPGAHAISTAIGYNQLLSTNSVELLAENGASFVAKLEEIRSKAPPDMAADLGSRIEIFRKMIAVASSVPDDWSRHETLAGTPDGLGIHALNFDVDIGPLLQVQKLLDSIVFARRKEMTRGLTAAELEMMNLTGDGNGYDMISMPDELRPMVPTANFFQRGGYDRNPVASRNDTVAALLAATDTKMDKEAKLPGALELARAFDMP